MVTMLIADDLPSKLFMLETLVKKSGIAEKILTAKNTDDAKKLIDENHIDCAFIDYEMPSEDGPAVIRYLHSKNPHALICLETASDNETYEHNGYEAGAAEFICTSYAEEEVVEKINRVLDLWKAEING